MIIDIQQFLKELLEKHNIKWKVKYYDNVDNIELIGKFDNYIITVSVSKDYKQFLNLTIKNIDNNNTGYSENIQYSFPILYSKGTPERVIYIYLLYPLIDIIKEQKVKILSEVSFFEIERGSKEISNKIYFLNMLYYYITGKSIKEENKEEEQCKQ